MDVTTVCDFLKQAIEELKQITPVENHQWKPTTIAPTANGHQYSFTNKPDFGMIIGFGHLEKKLPAIVDFVKIFESDEGFLQLVQQPDFTLYALQPEVMAQNLLIDYIQELIQLEYDSVLAEIVSKNFVESLEKGKSTVVFYTVLRGLESDMEGCIFSNSIRIRRLSDIEVIKLVNGKTRYWHYFNEDGVPQNRYVAEQVIEQPLNTFPDINIAHDLFSDLITALRLLKSGQVESQTTNTSYPYIGQIGTMSGTKIGRLVARNFPINKSYYLSQSDIPELQNLFAAIQEKTLFQRLMTAISRMNFASERIRPEDQLIDLMIAIEALYGGDGKTDLRYKLGMRCAAYLETTLEGRRKILSFMKKAYDKRSSLVHGSNSIKGLSTEETVTELRRIVQVSIKQMIKEIVDGRDAPNDDYFDDILLHDASK